MAKKESLMNAAPPLREDMKHTINDLFPAYLFRRTRTRELWTTCCHQHKTLSDRHATAEETAVFAREHQREPVNMFDASPEAETPCPYCGKLAIVKELGRTGRRGNLFREKNVVVLQWDGTALWAMVYIARKNYEESERDLTKMPFFHCLGAYRFQSGTAEQETKTVWGIKETEVQNGPLTGSRWHIHEPFHGEYYDVVGEDALALSPFRYCMAAEYIAHQHSDTIKFLTACCIYPRQIELLMKAGFIDVVHDLVARGKKNNIALNWDAADPSAAFRVGRKELKVFLASRNKKIDALVIFKRLKRVPMSTCVEWVENGLTEELFGRIVGETAKRGVSPEDMIRYLARQGHRGDIYNMWTAWYDYISNAERLNYEVWRPNVLLPKDLGQAHDEVVEKVREHYEAIRRAEDRRREKREAARKKAAAETYKKRKSSLVKKYEFELDGYRIMVPAGEEEIVAEGKALQHCVGGYAIRHMLGNTTILFMRKSADPGTPWLTIEMNGDTLQQIHGYRNEGVYSAHGRFAPDPREVYKDYLDTWLDWLKKGSKRYKDGRPRLPTKTRKEHDVA